MAKRTLNVKGAVTPTSSTPEVVLPTIGTKSKKDLGKEKLDLIMHEEMKLVKGIFQNFETPGLALRVQVRKYPGYFYDKTLQDGQAYEVPLYIARHLNGIDATATAINGQLGTCSYPIHSYLMDKNGVPVLSKQKRKKRYGFQSAEFGLV